MVRCSYFPEASSVRKFASGPAQAGCVASAGARQTFRLYRARKYRTLRFTSRALPATSSTPRCAIFVMGLRPDVQCTSSRRRAPCSNRVSFALPQTHLHQSPTFRKAVLRCRWAEPVRARTSHLRRMPRSFAQNATLSMRKRTTKHRISQLHQLASPQKEKQFGSATCVHIGPVATRTRRCRAALRLQSRSQQGKFLSSGKDAGLLSKRGAEPSASLASRAARGAARPAASQGKGAAARRLSSSFLRCFGALPHCPEAQRTRRPTAAH